MSWREAIASYRAHIPEKSRIDPMAMYGANVGLFEKPTNYVLYYGRERSVVATAEEVDMLLNAWGIPAESGWK